ncbi:hypothetical protein [Humidesulfovibrio idahonensis]
MVRVQVNEPKGDIFFVVFYEDDDAYEIRKFEALHYQRIKNSLTAAAKHYFGQQAGSMQCEIINHVGTLSLVPIIEDDDEAVDILDGNFHSFHWFEFSDES